MDDKRHGLGEVFFPDGRVYEGEYSDDNRHGYGIQTCSDGSFYQVPNWIAYGFDAAHKGAGAAPVHEMKELATTKRVEKRERSED